MVPLSICLCGHTYEAHVARKCTLCECNNCSAIVPTTEVLRRIDAALKAVK